MYWLQKKTLPVPALARADLALPLTYRYWSERKPGGMIPPRCIIDTPAFRLIVPDITWLDLRRPGPFDLGALAPFGEARALNGPGHGDDRLGLLLAIDVETTAVTGVPIYQTIHLCCGGRSLVYHHLLLPTADDGSHTTEVLSLARLDLAFATTDAAGKAMDQA